VPSPRVCVVLLNWNQPELTIKCVRCLLGQQVPEGFSTVVIDNGSTAENVAILQAGLGGECLLLRNGENLGFAGGMNIGIEHARQHHFEYVWLLNNDAFPDAGCLARLVAAADADPSLAAITPKLVQTDDTTQELGGRIEWETAGLLPLPHGPLPRPTPVGWFITGAALLIRMSALENDVAFDPRFFAYFEESDLCTRLIKCGRWNLAIEESARCVHLGGATTGVASPLVTHLMVRNAWLYVRKHRPWTAWPRLWLRQAAVQLIHAGALDAKGNRPQANAVLSALWAGLAGSFGRPRRMTLPNAIGGPILRHFSGIARRMWGLANLLAPPSLRRGPLGSPEQSGTAEC